MAALDCLSTLIGLSQTEYACFTDAVPDGFDTSDSGYFLTDADYGLEIIGTCETEGWGLLERARAAGIRDFKGDFSAMLRNQHASALRPFSGLIGQLKSSGVGLPTKTHIGHQITPARIKGAKLVLKGVKVGLNTAGTYALKIRSTDPLFEDIDDTVTVATGGAFASKVFSAEIELPFYTRAEMDSDELKYYVSIERGSAKPLNNGFACCGNNPEWRKHIDVAGFQADDATAETGLSVVAQAQGLVLDAYLTCGELDWVCELTEMDGLNYRAVVARAIQMRSAAVAIAEMLAKNTVNICTLYNIDGLQAKRNWLNNEYTSRLNWLAQNLPQGVTGCFTCKPTQKFSKTAKLV